MTMEPATSEKFSAYQEKQRQEGYARFRRHDVTDFDEGHYSVMRNRWWWCINGKPEAALFYRFLSHPLCNSDKECAEKLPHHPDAQLVFVPIAYICMEGYDT